MPYLFTSESVSEGHPDKVADQISDALLDHFLAFDPNAKVACETLVTTGQVILAGEVRSKTYIDVQNVARQVINKIGYTREAYGFSGDSCGVISLIHGQSPDIHRAVKRSHNEQQGAGDQGIMFGYATRETENRMPLALDLSHRILQELAQLRRERAAIPYLRPDAKAQVTVAYSDTDEPLYIDTIVVSTQHDDFDADEKMLRRIKTDLKSILMPRVIKKLPAKAQSLFTDRTTYYINPTGKFVIGGPHGDSGLTGRKIIVDTYGGKGSHGGGAFSGKDPSKVDRSASYAARHIAKNLVAAGLADQVLVQLSYAIGVAEPTSVYVNTFGSAKVKASDGEIARKVQALFDLRPAAIADRLRLHQPIYSETAAYGHMGKKPRVVTKIFESPHIGKIEREVTLFTWEKLDYVERIKKIFGLR